MRIGIQARILIFSIVLSFLFLLISRVLLKDIMVNSYWNNQVEKTISDVNVILEINSKDKIEKIMSFDTKNDLIEKIEVVDNEKYSKEKAIFGRLYIDSGREAYRRDSKREDGQNESIVYLNVDENRSIKMIMSEPNLAYREMGLSVAFKFLSLFILTFNIIFSLLIGKFITKKAKNLNSISKEMISGKSIKLIEKDILEDEFDELTETINNFTKNFNQDIEALEREKLYKKQLMLSLSHEIKTPIGGLNGILEGMLDNIEPYTDRDKYIRECRKLSAKLGKIANEMLDITKLDSVPTGKEEVVLGIMLEEICDELSTISLSKDVEVKNLIDDRITTFTDSVLFRRSIVNIIENAIKYAKDGTEVLIESKGYTIYFYNECDGLTKEDLMFVFNPLYRGSNRNSAKGRGIGLYIVKECLIALNITFAIQNYNKGVVFKINLKGEKLWD
ncbi:MAG: sensor histidine kinase [Clostridium sp.]|uniref:sensor histidine kinase n=1 Tax=Clostridium sp. TaxID=1506 RepID=UPI003EE751E9